MTYQQTIMEHELKAKNEGRLEEKNSNAVAMLKDNLSWEKVQQYTSLSMTQIEKLAKENALL